MPRPSSNFPWLATLGTLVVLALLATVTALGLEVRRQSRRLATAESALARVEGLEKAQASEVRTLAAQRKALAGVQGQQQLLDQRLQADEKSLNVARKALPPDVTALAARVTPSVVLLRCNDVFAGSGFALSLSPGSGYRSVVVTAAHVVAACRHQGDRVTVARGGTESAASVRAVGDPNDDDVALVDVRAALPALEAATRVRTGQFVMAVGTPLFEGNENNVTIGNVSKVRARSFLHTAPTSNGNSGGPLFDRDGRVLGFADAGYTPSIFNPSVENVNIALRLNVLCERLLPGAACPF